MGETWRLLIGEPAGGPENMAIDEAVLGLVGDGAAPPTLRFYEWRTPWVSLGSGQRSADLDAKGLTDRGWRLVRRASGGTAVLHLGQVGYSLILPSGHPIWAGDLARSYEKVAEPLRVGLSRLGVVAEAATPTLRASTNTTTPALADRVCFAALGPHELVASERKVVGSSQIRRRLSSTQHGVIQLTGGQAELAGVLADVNDDERATVAEFLRRSVVSIASLSTRATTVRDLVNAVVAGFEEQLGVSLEIGELQGQERDVAASLELEKFGHSSWTYRR